MPSVYHCHVSATDSPARFPVNCLVVDVRYGKQHGRSPYDVSRQFPQHYIHAPGGGSTTCTSGGQEAQPQLIDAAQGLAQVEAFAPAGDIVVLCHCRAHPTLAHREFVSRRLSTRLPGYTHGGALP